MTYSSVLIKNIDYTKGKQKQPREIRELLLEKNEEDEGYIWRIAVQIRGIYFNKERQKQPRKLRKLLLKKNGEDDGYIWRKVLYRSET